MPLSWTTLTSWKKKIDLRFLAWAGSDLLAVDVYLRTWKWDNDWLELVNGTDADRIRAGSAIQHVLTAWDGVAYAICNDGKVLVADVGAKTWTVHASSEPAYKADWALSAFDPERGAIVVWGAQKKKGRKDETWVFDGKTWTKCKKSKATFEDTDNERAGFSLYFDPARRAVVRIGQTSAGVFDGKTWTQSPLTGGDVLDHWDRISCVDAERVLTVQRFIARCDVIRVESGADGFAATRVETFPSAVNRDSRGSGGNAAFDVGIYDRGSRRLLAFDDQKNTAYTCDLASLL